MGNKENMFAVNIKWDLDFDDDEVELPEEIEIPDEIAELFIETSDPDVIDNYISNVTDYCHKGYALTFK